MLQRWLRVPFSDTETFCPQCNGVMDTFADHALTCCCGGDRTKRHNLIRNALHMLLQAAGCASELEKPGLLRPRPLLGSTHEDGSDRRDDDDSPEARRPADVYAPRWRNGLAACLDLAVTSGLRDDLVHLSARDPSTALLRYEDHKCSWKDTRRTCSEEGLLFVPLILEAVGGGWGPEGHKVLAELAKASASATGELSD
eukprot:7208310-Karenia_brevis.AAC.1